MKEVIGDDKTSRILTIYDSLRKGYILKKKELSDKFNVQDRTIQRDLEDIRTFLAENYEEQQLIYDYKKKGYCIDNRDKEIISGIEIFAFLKILIESRAFKKEELEVLVKSILSTVDKEERKSVKSLVENEIFHFEPVAHGKTILNLMWDIGQCIIKKEIIEINFTKANNEDGCRTIYPLAIVFSEFYFYLVAQIEEYKDKSPAFFRLDRINKFKRLDKHFKETKRFEDGELKKRVLFMYGGELINLKFKYKGQSIEAIMDRFPTAEIIEKENDNYLIHAEVYGKGCLMWLLSQGENIELISPKELRKEIVEKICNMKQIYDCK